MRNTCLITGTSRGIGRELAAAFAGEYYVIGLSRSPASITLPDYEHHVVDLSDEDALKEKLQKILDQHPDISVLVNNAATLHSLPLAVMDEAHIDAMVKVNLLSPIYCTRSVIRRMIHNKRGRILNVSSMAPQRLVPGDSVYAATKAALETFARIVNAEVASANIRVNCLAISAYESGMLEKIVAGDVKKVTQHIPHGKLTTIDEIIAAARYLLSFDHHDIGGQTIRLGGV